jgi:hypothetical protein
MNIKHYVCLGIVITGALGGPFYAQDSGSPLFRYNQWQGFIQTPDGTKPLKFQLGGHPSAQVITGSFSTPDYETTCTISPTHLEIQSSYTFHCPKGQGDEIEVFQLNVDSRSDKNPTISGQWGDRSFILCPVYPDKRATDACMEGISTRLGSVESGTSRDPRSPAERIRQSIPKIENAFSTLKAKGIRVTSASGPRIEFMREFYTLPGKVPNRYADTLESMADLLTQAAENPNPDTQALVTDVSENLEIMYAASAPSSDSPATHDQDIKVATMRGTKEVSGWEIFYMEYFFRHVRSEIGPDSFPRPSSPTSHRLPPSRYIFQAVNVKTGKKSEAKVVTVNDQSVDCVIELK